MNEAITLSREIVRNDVFLADAVSTLSAMLGSSSGALSKVSRNSPAPAQLEALGKQAAVLQLIIEYFGQDTREVEKACIRELSEIRDFLRK